MERPIKLVTMPYNTLFPEFFEFTKKPATTPVKRAGKTIKL